jgi:molecular chaperone DnaJ
MEPFRQVEPVSSFREVSVSQSFDTFSPSFEEIFDRLWSNFELLTRPKAERLASLTMDVPLSSQEALTGGSVRILVPARITCQGCQGHGAVGFHECWRCRGQGSITAEYPFEVTYPSGLRRDYVVRVPLDDFGIHNFFLTIRFRPTEMI